MAQMENASVPRGTERLMAASSNRLLLRSLGFLSGIGFSFFPARLEIKIAITEESGMINVLRLQYEVFAITCVVEKDLPSLRL